MIFAPVMRRAAVAYAPAYSPRAADAAVQRFMADALRASRPAQRTPGLQFSHDEKSFTLQLDVPGLAREQLDIEIENDVVRVKSVEGAARPFQGAWQLPETVDATTSRAKLEHGVLTLTLTRIQPENKATRLAVE